MDSDNDGVCDNVDKDWDNDGILNIVECPQFVFPSSNDGLSSGTAFENVAQAKDVTTPGIYFFNFDGFIFSTYVENGYLLVAHDYGNGTGSLPQSTTVNNTTRGILIPAILSGLTDANQIRISQSQGLIDVTTTNATLLDKLRNNVSLNTGKDDVAFNTEWVGTGAETFNRGSESRACYDGVSLILHENIFWPCGDAYGFHWQPKGNFQRVRFSRGANSGEMSSTASISLWVKHISQSCIDTDGDGIEDYLDLDSDGDGCSDAIEGTGGLKFSDLSGDALSGSVDSDGIPVSANGGQNQGSGLNGVVRSAACDACEDTDNDGVCDGVDLDDDNDGILDEIECPNTYVSKAFQTSNGTTTTFLAPSADGGFQFDIFKLDNSFNLKVNGIDVVPNQIQCFGNGLAGESLLVFDSDNTGFGQGGNDQVWVINGDTEKPVVRLKIDSKGEITFEGKRSSGRELEPMKILSGDPQPLNIVWNTTGENEVVLSQKVDGPTNIAGEGHGIVMCTIDTDGDGIKNSLDTDSDGDGCQDALEGGAGFESTDLSGEVLSGVVGTNGVPVLAGNGQTVGTSVNDLQKAPVCDCDDNDGDGVCDDYDLDDDNDGILDIDECMTSNFQWSGVPSVNGKTAIGVINGVGYTYTSSINIETTPTIFAYNKFPSHYNIPNTTVIKNRFTSNNVITFDQPVLNPTLMFSSIGGGPTVPIEFSNAVEVLFQSGPVTINSPTKITGKEGYVVLRMNGVFNQISFDYLANENYVNFTFGADFATHCDTDGDGIVDYLDLDSDDDGCADAVEGDAGFKLSDINNDVLAGNIDANGVPVSAAGGQAIGSSADENTQSIVCEVCDVDKPVVNGIDGTPFYNFYFDSSKELNETVNGLEVGEKYKIKVSGTWSVWSSDPTKNVMDAAYRYKEKNASANITPVAGIFWQINGANANRPSPDGYNTEHTYYFERVATGEGERFTWSDSHYGDNGGGLNFEFYKVLDTIRVCPSNSSTLLSDYVTGQSLKWYSSEISSDGTATVPSVDNNQFGVTEFWVSQTIDGCESERAQILYLVKDTIVFDLGNDTTICEKESVTLNAPLATSYSWSTGANTQSIDVTTTGIYTIEISNEKGCKSSDSKEINIEGCIIDHFDEDTIYICKGESIQIEAKDITDEIWGGDEDFILLNQSTIQVSPDQDAYYFVGSEAGYTVGQNIIINGDFEQGGVGFTSGYTDGCVLNVLNEGRYCVNPNPKATHSGFRTCGDHTSGTGNMMVVNAATTAGVSVWCQTVTVEPATDYEFSGWITSVHPSNPAILEFKINGALMGSRLTASSTACKWDQYAAQWNSGLNTSVEICLDNQNTASGGNDFAIDDISFAPVIHNAIGGDSILVIVHDRPEVDLGGNNTICAGDSITLKTSLAGTYLWSNNSTQSFINVKESGNYSLEVTNAEGCKGDTTVNITIQELPIVNLEMTLRFVKEMILRFQLLIVEQVICGILVVIHKQ